MLANRLGISLGQLHALVSSGSNYLRWIDKKTDREIQQPKPILRAVHDRVAKLLARIETPDFLHSAVKGRSYISNASCHCPTLPSVTVDIKKFYPNTRAQAVYHFFRDRMDCAGDVAGMLAELLTVDGHLATGSSASPILSYFAYEDMFAEIADKARLRGCVMSCYVDDMVFTGKGATPRLIHEVRAIARPYRLWTHKTKAFGPGEPKVITGLAITTSGPRVPNRRRARILVELRRFQRAPAATTVELLRSLVGRLHEAAHIDPSWKPRALWASAQLRLRGNANSASTEPQK